MYQVPHAPGIANAGAWISSLSSSSDLPTELMTRIQQALDDRAAGHLAAQYRGGSRLLLDRSAVHESHTEHVERLPASRARREAAVRSGAAVEEFVRHVLEAWVARAACLLVSGPGLADARARGKMLLRLRIILDEGGWMLTSGATYRRPA